MPTQLIPKQHTPVQSSGPRSTTPSRLKARHLSQGAGLFAASGRISTHGIQHERLLSIYCGPDTMTVTEKLTDLQHVRDVADFHTEHSRWPSPVSRDGFERALGVWLNRQRIQRGTGTMDEFRCAHLDENLPGWNITAEEAWLARSRETSDFFLNEKRAPAMDADAAEERLTAIWLGLQRTLRSAGILPAHRQAWLDEHCPGWAAGPETAGR